MMNKCGGKQGLSLTIYYRGWARDGARAWSHCSCLEGSISCSSSAISFDPRPQLPAEVHELADRTKRQLQIIGLVPGYVVWQF